VIEFWRSKVHQKLKTRKSREKGDMYRGKKKKSSKVKKKVRGKDVRLGLKNTEGGGPVSAPTKKKLKEGKRENHETCCKGSRRKSGEKRDAKVC